MAFQKPSNGGKYFKFDERANDLAIVLEPKRVVTENDPNNEGEERTVAYADIACFRNSEDVENRTPSYIEKGVKFTNSILVSDIIDNDWVGGVALVKVAKPKRAVVYREVDYPGAEEAALAWYEARENETASNLDEVPDFE